MFLPQYEHRGAGPEWLEQGDFDGVILRCDKPELLEAALRLDVPVVDYSMDQLAVNAGLAAVLLDNHAIGRLVAEHFLERGFGHFAFAAGTTTMSAERYAGFTERLGEAGHTASSLNVMAPRGEYWPTYDPRVDDEVCHWLTSLPRPLGVMAFRDPAGVVVLNACQHMGQRVPDDVAVVGVHDDQQLCELAYPPMSSVRTPLEKFGYEAAALLHAMLESEPPPPDPVVLPPLDVLVRRSSDVFAVADPDLRDALRWIYEHAAENVEVTDLLKDLGLDRRNLERKFHNELNRSPAQQIRAEHLSRARRQLLDTDAPMSEVAIRSGFANATRLAEAFRRDLGISPTEYRRRHR